MRHLALTVLVVLASNPARAEDASPELLARIGQWAERTDLERALDALTIRTVSEELDADGKVLHTDDLTMRLAGEDDRRTTEVLSATHDGEDNKAEVEKKQAEAKEKAKKAGAEEARRGMRNGVYSAALPFSPDQQPKYRFTVLPPLADDPRMLHLGFGPKGEPEKELFTGEAKIDPDSGAVLWLRQRPSKLPMVVERLELEFFFGTPSPLGPMMSELKLRGAAGVLFLKKRFRASMRFSDFVFKR